MEIAELRTGNLVINSSDKLCRVMYIDGRFEPHQINVQILSDPPITISDKSTHRVESYNIEEINPISLDNEWMLKLGFKSNSTFDIFEHSNFNEFTIRIYGFNYELWHQDSLASSLQICHVHQLQNLYFALTGQELDIKF